MNLFQNTLLCFALVVTNLFSVSAQEVGIEHPELNVLYRGYDNKLLLVFSDSTALDVNDVVVSGTNCTISKASKPGVYIVKPGTGFKSAITLQKKVNDALVDIYSIEYRVLNLPDPVLFWGASKSGVKASKISRLLLAKYTPEIPLQAHFKVEKWTLSSPAGTVSGEGGNLSAAASVLQATNNCLVSIQAVVKGPDGISRLVGGSWQIGELPE